MSPSIRIDGDVYEYLKAHAEPFVDTPNTVLRRLLSLEAPPEGESEAPRAGPSQSRPRKPRKRARAKRAAVGPLLPVDEYERPVLEALLEMGGSAPTRQVVEQVGQRLSSRFTDADCETIASGQVRWKSRVQFARLKLREDGYIDGSAERGQWRLTKRGEERAREAGSGGTGG